MCLIIIAPSYEEDSNILMHILLLFLPISPTICAHLKTKCFSTFPIACRLILSCSSWYLEKQITYFYFFFIFFLLWFMFLFDFFLYCLPFNRSYLGLPWWLNPCVLFLHVPAGFSFLIKVLLELAPLHQSLPSLPNPASITSAPQHPILSKRIFFILLFTNLSSFHRDDIFFFTTGSLFTL